MMSKAKRVIEEKDQRIAELEAQIVAIVSGRPELTKIPDAKFWAIYEMGQDSIIRYVEDVLEPLFVSVAKLESSLSAIQTTILIDPKIDEKADLLKQFALQIGEHMNAVDVAKSGLVDSHDRIDLTDVANLRKLLLKAVKGNVSRNDLRTAFTEFDFNDVKLLVREIKMRDRRLAPETHARYSRVNTIMEGDPSISLSRAFEIVADEEGVSPYTIRNSYKKVAVRGSD